MNEQNLLPESLRKPFKAILFDLDGTLFDSEEIHYTAFSKAMEQYGYDFSAMVQKVSSHGSFRKMFEEIAQTNQISEDQKNSIYERKTEITLEIPATSVDAVEGILSFLELQQERNMPMSVVTNSDREYADYALTSHEVTDYFEDVITASELENAKPDPEGYIKAAKLLQVDPSECLVFENTDDGIAAGKAAGMCVIAIHGTDIKGFSNYEAADLVINDFADPNLDDINFVGRE